MSSVRLPSPGNDAGVWGELLNDFLLVEHNSDGTLKIAATLADKADNDEVVHLSGSETIDGQKTFSASPIVPLPTAATHAAHKSYVDDAVGALSDDLSTVATTGSYNDLSDRPTIPTPQLSIGTSEPSPPPGQQVLWVDTTGGNVTLNLVTGE